MPTMLKFVDENGEHYAAPLGDSFDTSVPVYSEQVKTDFTVKPFLGESFQISHDLNGFLELVSLKPNTETGTIVYSEIIQNQELLKQFNVFDLVIGYSDGKISVEVPVTFGIGLEELFDKALYVTLNYTLTVFDSESGKVAKYNIPILKFFSTK